MSDFYKMVETPLDRAVDKAIEAANETFLASPESQEAIDAHADRWKALTEAEAAVGPHGVVLPVATAQAILAVLEGRPEDTSLSRYSPDLPVLMLREKIDKVAPVITNPFLLLIASVATDLCTEKTLIEHIDGLRLPPLARQDLLEEVLTAFGYPGSGYDSDQAFVDFLVHQRTVLGTPYLTLLDVLRRHALQMEENR